MILTKERRNGIDLSEVIRGKLEQGSLSSLLLIVPTNRKLRNLKKELIASSNRQTAAVINLETIGTLSNRLLAEYTSYIPLTDAAASILLKQSIAESKLIYFSGYYGEIPTGTLDRIGNVISEYKRSGIQPEDLLRESESLSGSEKNKAADIAQIYKHYQIKCNQLGVKETGDVYSGLNSISIDEFRKTFNSLFPQVNLIIMDGFNEFTVPEIELIDKLSCVGKELYLNFDYFGNNPLIFSHLDKCYNLLVERGFSPVIDFSSETQSLFRSNIRTQLFNQIQARQSAFKDHINLFSGLNREKEIEFIAKEIKTLILEKKVHPHRICVSFNLIDKYSPLIRDIFANSGIPFNLTDRLSLAKSPPVTIIINYLEILENDFYYKNLFRALSNEQLRIKQIDLAGLIKVSVRLKIISGYHNWVSSIREAIEQLNIDTETDNITREKDLRLYRKALEDIESINEFLNPFTMKLTLREFLKKLKTLVNEIGLPLKLLDIGGKEEENIKSVTVFLDTISEVFKLMELEYSAEQKFTLDFFLDKIRTAVIAARFNIKEKSSYGVLVTTFNEIRGLNFDYLFLSGLSDGDFPTRYNPEIFFSGSYVRNELIHQTEERYNFYQVLCSWERGLYLTYPLQDKEKELTPSNYLKDFTDLFELTELSADVFNKHIYSKDELLKLMGSMDISQLKSDNRYQLDWDGLAEAINTDSQRMSDPFGESIHTGSLTPQSPDDQTKFNLSQAALERLKQIGEREFSITQLEKYASCPYQYFLERVLFLNIIEEPSEEFEAFEIGTLIHSILYDFYIELSKKNIRLAGCNEHQFRSAGDLLFRIAESKVAETSFNSVLSFYDKEALLGIDGNRKNSVLYKFLETERMSSEDFIPMLFEQNFNETITDDNNTVRIRGKIDRIEVNVKENTFNTVDYKLGGKKPSAEDLSAGISLQLPLYMYAASKLLKASFDKEYLPADALIYSLKYKADRFGRHSINLKGKKSYTDLNEDEKTELLKRNQETIQVCIDTIIKFTESIKAGRFHLSTLTDRDNKVCRFCNFHSICRIQEAV